MALVLDRGVAPSRAGRPDEDRPSTGRRDSEPEWPRSEPVRTARGVLIGLVLGVVGWIVAGWLLLRWLHE